MAKAVSPLYAIRSPERLHVRRWADEAVVYDDFSGDTHVLDRHALGVLDRLLQGPAPAAELEAVLADAPDGLLGELERLGLCEAERE